MSEPTEKFSMEQPGVGSAPSPRASTLDWRTDFQASEHPLSACLGHLVAYDAVITASPPTGVKYLFSRSTLEFLEQAAGFSLEMPTSFGDGFRRVLDIDSAVMELLTRALGGSTGRYEFERSSDRLRAALDPVTPAERTKVDPSETAVGPGVVEALALSAWISAEKTGEIAPVNLDEFVFGLMAVTAMEASMLGRALGPAPSLAQAAVLRREIPALLSELATRMGRPRAIEFAAEAPGTWPPLPEPEETPDYRPDRPIEELGHDLLGFGEDARAIAEMLCLDKAGARAVGVFGDWGSGKSSLLNLVELQIDALLGQTPPATDDEAARAAPFIRRAEHIRFNVWQYNDSELMLALADVTLKQLRRFGAIEALQRRFEQERAEWRNTKAQGEDAIAAAERRHREAIARIETSETTADAEKETAKDAALTEINRLLRQEGAGAKAASDLLSLAESGKALFSSLSLAKMRYFLAANRGYWVAALGLAGLGAVISWQATGGTSSFATAVAGLVGFCLPFARFLSALDAALMGYARAVDDAERAHIAEIAKARRESDAALQDIAAQTRKVDAAVTKIETYAGEGVAPLWRYLLHDSPAAQEIERARGVTSRVQDIFESINELIGTERQGGAADADALPDRVIFYIDELDRCRAAQVVRMLEAIHLLLAFENFAVIVAVDSRWLVASLRSVFREELARSDPNDGGEPGKITVHEYIEKIIQLPVQVRPLAFDATVASAPSGTFVSLIDHLTEAAHQADDDQQDGVEGDADGAEVRIEPLRVAPQDVMPRETLKAAAERARLTEEEVEGLRRLGGFVGSSPRTVKRLVNVYRLVRALQTGEAFERFQEGGFRPVQLCLAIQCGMVADDVARLRDWLHADGMGVPDDLEALLSGLGPAGASYGADLIGEQLARPAGKDTLRRAWAMTERFTFWSGTDAYRRGGGSTSVERVGIA